MLRRLATCLAIAFVLALAAALFAVGARTMAL